jgi:hypothetical protein
MADRREYFKLYNQKRKEYLNQKAKERYKMKKIEQQEGGEIRKIINQCEKCGTTYLLVKK